ncbi:MAG TPA: RNase adapter RapZ [Myxococcales bacterium LLY-WYZ-16_1]|jgi:RNase adapter protein RapZ|nr:RNase adapter RapZ [Myxococcales bacterium LLY-WYZ-16_1]
MRIVVLTGLSGSGKTSALRALEDAGYYAIDNLPIRLLEPLIAQFETEDAPRPEQLALVVDARTALMSSRDGPQNTTKARARAELELIPPMLEAARRGGRQVDLVFFDASTEILERRYSETRRRHPLSSDGSVLSGIEAERAILEPLRQDAHTHLDTSQMSVHDLRRAVQLAFAPDPGHLPGLAISIISFGFKHGLPPEADLVFDVRFLPNPHFIPELRVLSGNDAPVADYVWALPEAGAFLERLYPLLEFLIPQYQQEGKAYLTLAVGCTGGRHRSVALARKIAAWCAERGLRSELRHRDVDR